MKPDASASSPYDPLAATGSFVGETAPESEERLIAVLDEYVAALEKGSAPSIEVYAQQHSELGDELIECLEGVRTIHDAVQAAQSAPDDAGLGGSPSESSIVLEPDLTGAPASVGDYRLIREIGRGGMGVVYEAEEQSLRRRVALKVLPFAAVLDQRQITRFRNEAQAAAGLHHTNIVPVFAIGQERGVHFYAMQHIEGRSLAEAITELRGGGPGTPIASPTATTQALGAALAPTPAASNSQRSNEGSQKGAETTTSASTERSVSGTSAAPPTLGPNNRSTSFFHAAASLAADAADALQHAHDLGVVHRDVKPSNLLIDLRGKVWVADFGLARMQSDLGVTATGDVVGTLRYMSPEQARGRADQVDGRTDVYALGATLYELLTLRHAHPGDDRRRILDRLEKVDPTPLRKHNTAIPVDLENIVLRAMEKDRHARYASAGELRDDLRRYLDGRPTIARPPSIADRMSKWMRRRRRSVAIVAIASSIVAAVSLAALVLVNQARSSAEAALVEVEQQRARADGLADEALGLVDRFGAELPDQLSSLPGSEPIRASLLSDSLDFYRRVLTVSGADPLRAAPTRIRAAATAERLGRTDEADRLYHEAADELNTLLAETPADRKSAGWLARCLNNHALLMSQRGDVTAAEQAIDRAIELRRGLLDESPRSIGRIADLAGALVDRAAMLPVESTAANLSLEEAIALLSGAQRSAPDDAQLLRQTAKTYQTLSTRQQIAAPALAMEAIDHAIALLERLVRDAPEVSTYRSDLAVAYSKRGVIATRQGDWRLAESAYSAASRELAGLAKQSPLVPRYRSDLSIALASQGVSLANLRRFDESDRVFKLAERTLEGLVVDYPQVDRYRRGLAALWNNRGVALRDSGRLDEAATAFAQSVSLEENRIAATNQPGPTLLAAHYANYAQVLGRLDRFNEAAAIETKRKAFLEKHLPPSGQTSGKPQ